MSSLCYTVGSVDIQCRSVVISVNHGGKHFTQGTQGFPTLPFPAFFQDRVSLHRALTVLELRLALDLEICLPLTTKSWD